MPVIGSMLGAFFPLYNLILTLTLYREGIVLILQKRKLKQPRPVGIDWFAFDYIISKGREACIKNLICLAPKPLFFLLCCNIKLPGFKILSMSSILATH